MANYFQVPINAVAKRKLTTRLGSTPIVLITRWNSRTAAWYVDVETVAGERLLSGARLCSNWPVWTRYPGIDGLPDGLFLVVDKNGTWEEPTRSGLGTRFVGLFIPSASAADSASGGSVAIKVTPSFELF